MKSWHISSITITGILMSIFIMGSVNLAGFSAGLMLALLPALIWFGWTLHERSLYRNEILEQRVMDKLRNEDVALRRRKVNGDV